MKKEKNKEGNFYLFIIIIIILFYFILFSMCYSFFTQPINQPKGKCFKMFCLGRKK